MSLEIKNTKELLDPENVRLKVLIMALPGAGKTEWISDAPNVGVAACEVGHGKGLLTVAEKNLDYIEPTSMADFDAICSGQIFKDKETIVLDSLTEMVKTFVKDDALRIPRTRGQSPKRAKGVPELDDYGVMGEITRRLLKKLIGLDKHIIATATLRFQQPDAETGRGAFLIGPDLPGQLFLGSTAMFDICLCLKTRQLLRNPKDAKSRYTERFLLTEGDGTHVVKCRWVRNGKSLLDAEEIFEKGGRGTFKYILDKIKKGCAEGAERV